MRRVLAIGLVGVGACSSFAAELPAEDAGAPAITDEPGAPAADSPVDASAPDSDADAGDGGPDVVYRNNFSTKDGVVPVRANVSLVNGRIGGMALDVCGTGGTTDGGVFGAEMGKLLGTPGPGRYLVRLWVRHDAPNGLPSLAIGLTTGTYANVTDPSMDDVSPDDPKSLGPAWMELVHELRITGASQYAAARVVATPQSGAATGCYRLDDFALERLPD